MCGLFGAFASASSDLSSADVDRVYDIARRSQRRGVDASGLVIVEASEIRTAKSATGIGRLLRDPAVESELRRANGRAHAVFGHTRLATHGSIGNSKNNHPVVSERWLVVHNGWITNRSEIMDRFARPGEVDPPDTDSYAINLVLEAWLDKEDASVESLVAHLAGEFTFIAWARDGRGLAYTNVGNLYVASEGSTTHVASEPVFFPRTLRHLARQVDLCRTVVPADAGAAELAVEPIAVTVNGRRPVQPGRAETSRQRELTDRLSELYVQITEWTKTFDRCSRCVLPTHFPHFDADRSGLCSFCQEYRPVEYGGVDAFREQISRRLPKDSRQVIVGLSGGRDSCFSMHLVHALGFEPLAFTYDWGLVTNEARENMARMCGVLGCEHILVARDIQEIKRRLRGGLSALLRTPDMAVVPLLMSGDKSWMHWAERVARERGKVPIVMGTHRAETTGFKSSLATGTRARPHGDVQQFWRIGGKSVARMAARYAGFGVREPQAIPILLHDAFPGAWHYYVRHQDMVLPFDYVEWDRDEIEFTIATHYGWEFGTSGSKWRAGDGTAVVYNLLYIACLGFSEMETFLSNQIRSNAITRDAALDQLMARPPLDTDQLVGYLRFIEADIETSLAGFVDVVTTSEGVA